MAAYRRGMTYSHLWADCLYTGISSGPNARWRVWENFIVFTSFSMKHNIFCNWVWCFVLLHWHHHSVCLHAGLCCVSWNDNNHCGIGNAGKFYLRWGKTSVKVAALDCMHTWSYRDLSLGFETSWDSFFNVLVLILVLHVVVHYIVVFYWDVIHIYHICV